MWPWREKKESEPIRKKRKPKEWRIPKDRAAELIELYDGMMRAARQGLIEKGYAKKLPRFLFWQAVLEAIPEIRGYSVQVEDSGDCFCIKIVETVADDDYESEVTEITQESLESLPTIEESLDEIEAKPDREIVDG
jgi:hypothetical protein